MVIRPGLMEMREAEIDIDAKRRRSLLSKLAVVVVVTTVCAFAAWQGAAFWGMTNASLVLGMPALLVWMYMIPFMRTALKNRVYFLFLLGCLGAPILAAITFGGPLLLLAYLVSQTVAAWQSVVLRIIAWAIIGLGASVLLVTYSSGRRQVGSGSSPSLELVEDEVV